MDSTEVLAERRKELTAKRVKVKQQIAEQRAKLAEIDLELGAIDAYDEHMARRLKSLDAQVRVRTGRGEVSRETVLAVIRGKQAAWVCRGAKSSKRSGSKETGRAKSR